MVATEFPEPIGTTCLRCWGSKKCQKCKGENIETCSCWEGQCPLCGGDGKYKKPIVKD